MRLLIYIAYILSILFGIPGLYTRHVQPSNQISFARAFPAIRSTNAISCARTCVSVRIPCAQSHTQQTP